MLGVGSSDVIDTGIYGGIDPTGVADSTAALQLALNDAAANYKPKTVYLRSGVYRITAPLTVPLVNDVTLCGAGWGTQITYDGNLVSTAIAMADMTTRRFNIRNLRISQTNATAAGTAIEASYFVNSVIEHVLIDGGGNSGVAPLIGISFNSNTTFYNMVRDCRINCSGANSIGVRFDTAANSNVVTNCRILPDVSASSSIGVYVNARSILLDHVDIESSAGTGISLGSSGHGCTMIAPYLEANGTNLSLASGVNAPTVIGGTLESGTTADITDSGALGPRYFNVRSSAGGEHQVSRYPIVALRDPSDAGFIAWSYDPAILGSNTSAAAGTQYLAALPVRYPTTITNLAICIDTAGSAATGSQNYLTLYNAGGTLVGQTAAGAIDAAVSSSGLLKQAMATAYAATPGKYYVGAFFNAATLPKFARGSGEGASFINAGTTAAGYWYAVNGTALTTTPPANITPSANSQVTIIPFWAGIS